MLPSFLSFRASLATALLSRFPPFLPTCADALKSLRAGALPGSTSNLLSRLQSFLPQLADANAQLAAKIAQEGQAAVDIEAVDEAEGRYIAMNVALAPLARGEGSSSDDDDSDAEDDSDSSEDEGGAAAASSSSSSGGGAGGRSGAAMSDEDGGITHLRASRGGVSKPSLPGIEGITPADALLLLGMVPGVAAAEAPSSDEGSDSSDSDEGMGGPSSGARRSGRRGGGGRSGRGGARHGKKRGRR